LQSWLSQQVVGSNGNYDHVTHAVPMTSARLVYRPLSEDTLDDVHRLVPDDHVRRYLLDGDWSSRAWRRRVSGRES
jgi:hypothetical protein